ncbi:MAG TPA: hypothetical protein VIT22_09950 [Pseudoxanthomonas sp.]
MNKSAPIFVAVARILLTDCHVEGHSYFLTNGEPERFSTMESCKSEATAKHSDGTPKYAGYNCTKKLLFVEIGQQDFYGGEARKRAVR